MRTFSCLEKRIVIVNLVKGRMEIKQIVFKVPFYLSPCVFLEFCIQYLKWNDLCYVYNNLHHNKDTQLAVFLLKQFKFHLLNTGHFGGFFCFVKIPIYKHRKCSFSRKVNISSLLLQYNIVSTLHAVKHVPLPLSGCLASFNGIQIYCKQLNLFSLTLFPLYKILTGFVAVQYIYWSSLNILYVFQK